MSIEHIDINVKVRKTTSNAIKVTSGLRQGNSLSLILFNIIALKKVIRNIGIDQGGVRLG
jgi:hypothetical protein